MALDSNDSSFTIVYKTSKWDRMEEAFNTFGILCVFFWMAGVFVFQKFLLPHIAPEQRAALALAVALPPALLAARRRYSRLYDTFTLAPGSLQFHIGTNVEQVPPEDVRALVGLGGVSFDHNEIIVWKQLVVLTDNRSRIVKLGHHDNASCYACLQALCPHAWRVPFNGDLESPHPHESQFHSDALSSLMVLRRYYGRKTTKHLCLAVGLMVVSIAAFACLLFLTELAGEVAKGLALLIMMVIVAIFQFVIGFRQLSTLLAMRRAEHAICGIMDEANQ